MMYEFNLPSVSGNTVSLADYSDKKGVAVVFTCNHCPYAIAYEKRLKDLHECFAPQDVPVVAISSNDAKQYPQDSFELMKVRAEQRGFPFEYLYDESQETARSYGALKTPHVFLLANTDHGFKLIYAGAIDDNYADANGVKHHYLADAIEAVIAGKQTHMAETIPVGCSVKWKPENQ